VAPDQVSVLEESILKLSGQLSTISRNQKYFRTRENRNFSTVRSTERRIFNFSLMEGGLIVAMAGLQVFVVRFFFQGARKGMLRVVFFWGVLGGEREIGCGWGWGWGSWPCVWRLEICQRGRGCGETFC
jgi:hypothetical protein